MEEVVKVGKRFISLLYKGDPKLPLNVQRGNDFKRKKTPKIQSLPPTDESAEVHIKRSHLTAGDWKSADQLQPPARDITDYGWYIKGGTLRLCTGVNKVAPKEILETVACNCGSGTPCASQKCSCKNAGLPCTSFCKCDETGNCANPFTCNDASAESSGEEDDEEAI